MKEKHKWKQRALEFRAYVPKEHWIYDVEKERTAKILWPKYSEKYLCIDNYERTVYTESEGLSSECENDRKDQIFTVQYTGKNDSTGWEQLTETERENWTRYRNTPSEWNGKKIFEGDIVNITTQEGGCFKEYRCIQYTPGHGFNVPDYGYYGEGDDPDKTFLDYEVLGNVFQHLKLVEKLEKSVYWNKG